MNKWILVFFLSAIFFSCSKDSRTEDEMIADFIADNNLEGFFTDSGIFVSIPNPGTGEHPTIQNKVTTHYEGQYVQDGEIFDSSLDRSPLTFQLNGVIQGWKEGIPYFGVGDEGWLVIPSSLAYGSFPPPGVRANAPMAFFIQLLSIQ